MENLSIGLNCLQLYVLKLQSCDIINRHVLLNKEFAAKSVPKGRLMSEMEWRSIGVQQSRGWIHYANHRYLLYYVCMLALILILFIGLNLIFYYSGDLWVPMVSQVRLILM